MTLDEGDRAFTNEVKTRSGQNASRCMQCGKCTAGCPVGFEADRPVNAMIRLIQEGRREEALGSTFIWLCAQCRTCSVRCPQEIDVAALMGALRSMSWQGGQAADGRVRTFLGAFVDSVRRHGRVYERSTTWPWRPRRCPNFPSARTPRRARTKCAPSSSAP